MLVNFTFQNFRSFRDAKSLRMEATTIKELKESVIPKGGYDLLPVAVMYGANSSGKSNVLQALATMRRIVLDSVRLNPDDKLFFKPFLLDLDSPKTPTSFEIQILIDDVKYRYGFDYNQERICKEWLYEKRDKEREYNLFLRIGNGFSVSKSRFSEGMGKEDATPDNRLFVSLVAQLNGQKSKSILEWFGKCNYLSGIDAQGYEGFTLQMFFEHLDGHQQALEFFHHTQLGFKNLIVTEHPVTEDMLGRVPGHNALKEKWLEQIKDSRFVDVQTTHYIYDRQGIPLREVGFNQDEMESEGTKKIIEMSGPIFDTLRQGKLLIVDELEAKLHPFLTRSILRLFMSPETNPHGAQLIFGTHDTNLLDVRLLRRDQIWFTEKDGTEVSDLYSLVEFRNGNGTKVRNDSSIRKDYMNGRYGAIPFLE